MRSRTTSTPRPGSHAFRAAPRGPQILRCHATTSPPNTTSSRRSTTRATRLAAASTSVSLRMRTKRLGRRRGYCSFPGRCGGATGRLRLGGRPTTSWLGDAGWPHSPGSDRGPTRGASRTPANAALEAAASAHAAALSLVVQSRRPGVGQRGDFGTVLSGRGCCDSQRPGNAAIGTSLLVPVAVA